jgi:hypothetical protein
LTLQQQPQGKEKRGKTYAKLEIANDIETTMQEILDLENQLKAGQDV